MKKKKEKKLKKLVTGFAIIGIVYFLYNYFVSLSNKGKLGIIIWWSIFWILFFLSDRLQVTDLKSYILVLLWLFWIWWGYIKIRNKNWLFIKSKGLYEPKI